MRASASKLKTLALCPRKWWRIYLNGERQESKAFEEGSRYHKEAENYLMTKDENMLSPVSSALIPHIRDLAINPELIEKWVSYQPAISPLPISGRIDLLHEGPEGTAVIDFKFLKDLKWAKTGAQLGWDIQMLNYGYWAVHEEFPGPITLRHLSVSKSRVGDVRKADKTLQREEIRTRFKKQVLPLIEEMDHHLSKDYLAASSVPVPEGAPDAPACRKYGGCPFREDCKILEGGRPEFAAFDVTYQRKMKEQIRHLFAAVPAQDQRLFLQVLNRQTLDEALEETSLNKLEEALKALKGWVDCPSPEETGRWVDMIPTKELTESLRDAPTASPNARRAAVEDCKERLGMDELPEHSGVIVPKDSPPTKAPRPIEEKEDMSSKHVSIIPGIGKKTVEGLVEKLGAPTQDLTTQYVADRARGWSGGPYKLAKEVYGMSDTKMDLILEAAPASEEEQEPKEKKTNGFVSEGAFSEDAPTDKEPATIHNIPEGENCPECGGAPAWGECANCINDAEMGTEEEEEEEEEVKKTRKNLAKEGPKKMPFLFVNCVPLFPAGKQVYLSDILEPYKEMVAKANCRDEDVPEGGVPLVELIQYNRGPASLASVVRAEAAKIQKRVLDQECCSVLCLSPSRAEMEAVRALKDHFLVVQGMIT